MWVEFFFRLLELSSQHHWVPLLSDKTLHHNRDRNQGLFVVWDCPKWIHYNWQEIAYLHLTSQPSDFQGEVPASVLETQLTKVTLTVMFTVSPTGHNDMNPT